MTKIYIKKNDKCYPEECVLVFDGKNFKISELGNTVYFDGEVVQKNKNGRYYICRTKI